MKCAIFWDVMPCSLVKNIIPEDINLYNHRCENRKSNKAIISVGYFSTLSTASNVKSDR